MFIQIPYPQKQKQTFEIKVVMATQFNNLFNVFVTFLLTAG